MAISDPSPIDTVGYCQIGVIENSRRSHFPLASMTRSRSRVKDRFCVERQNLATVLLAALKLNESETVGAFSAAGALRFGAAATRARPRLLR
ncbi:MAG: hypothetical protein AB7S70_06095 [Hyphomicrobium sp.]|uniref:hypothetical protein n=1 Tax=Hyphomicrobium sp. TaxID=82 RepID=UPI003D0D6501